MQIYTVSDVSNVIKNALESDPVLRDIWVAGEASNVFTSAAGHKYFTLKDPSSAIRGVLFAGNTGSDYLENGSSIHAHGKVSHYTSRGDTQLYVDEVVPAGVGALAAEFERLREKLANEGLFDQTRKRQLPRFPRAIGVITSEQGAVIHDIVNVISSRYPLVRVVLCPSAVQGANAPNELVQGIHKLNKFGEIDVIIVGRGGGSIEDLWAFNDENVARALYGSVIPIVSAVGHESDYTIADFVADYRAPTPSAAAAAVVPDRRVLMDEIAHLVQRAASVAAGRAEQQGRIVDDLTGRLNRLTPDFLTYRQRIDDLVERGSNSLTNAIVHKKEQINGLNAQLRVLDPHSVLERGYSILTDSSDHPIISRSQIRQGDVVHGRLKDGSFEAEVLS